MARIGTKHGLSVDLQRLIWADVTKNYYLRGSVTERAATLLQKYWRRVGKAIFGRAALAARYMRADPTLDERKDSEIAQHAICHTFETSQKRFAR